MIWACEKNGKVKITQKNIRVASNQKNGRRATHINVTKVYQKAMEDGASRLEYRRLWRGNMGQS